MGYSENNLKIYVLFFTIKTIYSVHPFYKKSSALHVTNRNTQICLLSAVEKKIVF